LLFALAACSDKPDPFFPDHSKTDVVKQANDYAAVAEINARSNVLTARIHLEQTKIEVEDFKIRSRAQIEVNKLVQDSVQDKALLKNWNLGTDGVSWFKNETSRSVISTTYLGGIGGNCTVYRVNGGSTEEQCH
jgi:hypothetical protein